MFSASLELILSIAYREAESRRHADLTLEHLLYALAHDVEAEKIMQDCGADLPALRHDLDNYLQRETDRLPRHSPGEPTQTLAFRRVLQTAVLHVQSAGKDEVHSGDVLAAILQQTNCFAAEQLLAQGVTRLDVLNYISHGIAKVPPAPNRDGVTPDQTVHAGTEDDAPSIQRDPLAAFTVNLSERAAAGQTDPLIGRSVELQRTMEVLCRRRKNNPVFVGDAGVGKTALAEGLAARLLDTTVPAPLQGAEVFSLDTTALLAGTRFRGDFEERFKAVLASLGQHAKPILFIDEVHAMLYEGKDVKQAVTDLTTRVPKSEN